MKSNYKYGGYWFLPKEMERLEQYAGLAKGLADRPLEGISNATESASSYRVKLPLRSPSSSTGSSQTGAYRNPQRNQ